MVVGKSSRRIKKRIPPQREEVLIRVGFVVSIRKKSPSYREAGVLPYPEFRAECFGKRVLMHHDIDGLGADEAFGHV